MALLVPGAQGASRKHGVITLPAAGPHYSFSLRDKAGYRLNVGGGDRGLVVLSVSRRGRSFRGLSNDYLSGSAAQLGRASPNGEINTDLGRFGRVAMQFEPSGNPKREKPIPGCKGGPKITESGVFVGVVQFRGEGSFTRFHAVRAAGAMTSKPRWRCPGFGHGAGQKAPEDSESEAPDEAALEVETPNGSRSFSAFGVHSSKLSASIFIATTRRRYPKVTEINSAFGFSKSPTGFEFDEGLTTSTVRPGSPFRGSATFQRGVAGAADRWTGSLAVSFLGGDVTLTGKHFAATLTRGQNSDVAAPITVVSHRREAPLRRVEQRALSLP